MHARIVLSLQSIFHQHPKKHNHRMRPYLTVYLFLCFSLFSFGGDYVIISSPTAVTQLITISTNNRLWDNPNNALLKDATFATTLVRLGNTSDHSAQLTYTSFDFSAIPSNATINGIEVTITRRALGGSAIADKTMQLTLGGENKARTTTSWSESWEDVTYGGPTDLWGLSFTLGQLSTVGLNVAAGRYTSSGTSNQFPQVDGITLAVYYSTPLPIELIEFRGRFLTETHTEVLWSTATEVNNSHFLLDRSYDGIDYEYVTRVNGAGYSQSRLDYTYNDTLDRRQNFIYYRIQQVDFNGDQEIYGPVIVRRVELFNFFIYPNPSTDYLFIETTNTNPLSGVKIYDRTGKVVVDETYAFESNLRIVDIRNLKKGTYFLDLSFSNGDREVKSFVRG